MDRYLVTAESLLKNRAFSVPDGASLEVEGVTAENFRAVKEKVLHILGDALCEAGGKSLPLSEMQEGEGRLLFPATDFLSK